MVVVPNLVLTLGLAFRSEYFEPMDAESAASAGAGPEPMADAAPEVPAEYAHPMDAEMAAAMGAGPEPDQDFNQPTPPPAYTPPPPPPAYSAPQSGPNAPAPMPMSPSDERTWGALAHLSSVLVLFTGIGGMVAAALIWLVYKDRSAYVGYQAAQSFWFQVGSLVAVTALSIAAAVLSYILIGLCLVPVVFVVGIAAFIYPLVGAYQCSQGQDFKYLLVGDMVPRP